MKDRVILAIKGIAIVGVVTHHILNRRQEHETGHVLIWLPLLLNWCVLGFVCVSGYLHAWSDSRRQKGLGEFMLLRFNRLLVPFFLLVLIYALIWQALRALHVHGIGVMVPPTFMGKLAVSLWPVNQRAVVAEQLYYLPLLFGASGAFVIVRQLLGLPFVWALVGITFVIGVAYFPADFTEFRLGTFLWSVCFYAAGYLLFCYRTRVSEIRLTLVVCSAILVVFTGYEGIVRSVPLWLIVEGSVLRLGDVPGLASLGEAAGTIYIYHTPFIIQTLVVASTYLPGPPLQIIGALAAGAIAIGICYIFYHLLKGTPAKIILM